MNSFALKHYGVMAVGLGSLVSNCLMAQPVPPVPSTNTANVGVGTSQGPTLPPLKSPIDFFREVLNRSGAERFEFLKGRSPASQRVILEKVREYEQLSPEQRELRLRVTELHYYLLPLMSVPAANRTNQLASISPEMRKLVEDRLQKWDQLSPESQKELLQNEATLRSLLEFANAPPGQPRPALSDAQRVELEAGIRKWRELSGEQRDSTIRRFNQFFDLTPEEKEHALSTLSEPERHQLERTLVSFENLSPLQRAQCVRSFQKFASLSPQERQQFLKSAEVWNRMSPSQRQLWKDLVYDLGHQPPLPAPLGQPPKPPPASSTLPGTGAGITGTN